MNLYHGGVQSGPLVFTEDGLRIFLREKQKNSLWDFPEIGSNLVHFPHDLVQLVDVFLLDHNQ